MSEYCIVLTTFESDDQATSVIKQVLDKKLAACVNCIEVKSKYFWKGELCADPEILAIIKTKDQLYDELKELLLEIHPYETPEVVKISIEDGSKAYLDWISEVTK